MCEAPIWGGQFLPVGVFTGQGGYKSLLYHFRHEDLLTIASSLPAYRGENMLCLDAKDFNEGEHGLNNM